MTVAVRNASSGVIQMVKLNITRLKRPLSYQIQGPEVTVLYKIPLTFINYQLLFKTITPLLSTLSININITAP